MFKVLTDNPEHDLRHFYVKADSFSVSDEGFLFYDVSGNAVTWLNSDDVLCVSLVDNFQLP